MTTIDEFQSAVKALKEAFFQLESLKAERPVKPKPVRKMVPHFGPASPTPDRDWGLNLEDCLLHERLDERIPGGLLNMAHDALSYTTRGDRVIEPITGPMVCAHLWREADEIVQRFPVVEDLVELMVTQAGFIARECELRERSQGIEAGAPQAQARMTSSVICPLLAQRGYDVSPELLRQWVKRGKITAYVQGGRNYYKLEEILRVGLVDCHGC